MLLCRSAMRKYVTTFCIVVYLLKMIINSKFEEVKLQENYGLLLIRLLIKTAG